MSVTETTGAGNVHDATSAGGQYLTFEVADAEYGVPILSVQEIRSAGKATPIPNAPDHVLGVINLRGAIVPIIDLRTRLELGPADSDGKAVVIVVRLAGDDKSRLAGLAVDAVSDVHTLCPEQLQPAPEFGSDPSAEWTTNLATVNDKMIILIDIDRMAALGDPAAETAVTGGSDPSETPVTKED